MATVARYLTLEEVQEAIRSFGDRERKSFCWVPSKQSWACVSWLHGDGSSKFCDQSCLAHITARQEADGSFLVDWSRAKAHITAAQVASMAECYAEDDEDEDEEDYMDLDDGLIDTAAGKAMEISVPTASSHSTTSSFFINPTASPEQSFGAASSSGSPHQAVVLPSASEELDDNVGPASNASLPSMVAVFAAYEEEEDDEEEEEETLLAESAPAHPELPDLDSPAQPFTVVDSAIEDAPVPAGDNERFVDTSATSSTLPAYLPDRIERRDSIEPNARTPTPLTDELEEKDGLIVTPVSTQLGQSEGSMPADLDVEEKDLTATERDIGVMGETREASPAAEGEDTDVMRVMERLDLAEAIVEHQPEAQGDMDMNSIDTQETQSVAASRSCTLIAERHSSPEAATPSSSSSPTASAIPQSQPSPATPVAAQPEGADKTEYRASKPPEIYQYAESPTSPMSTIDPACLQRQRPEDESNAPCATLAATLASQETTPIPRRAPSVAHSASSSRSGMRFSDMLDSPPPQSATEDSYAIDEFLRSVPNYQRTSKSISEPSTPRTAINVQVDRSFPYFEQEEEDEHATRRRNQKEAKSDIESLPADVAACIEGGIFGKDELLASSVDAADSDASTGNPYPLHTANSEDGDGRQAGQSDAMNAERGRSRRGTSGELQESPVFSGFSNKGKKLRGRRESQTYLISSSRTERGISHRNADMLRGKAGECIHSTPSPLTASRMISRADSLALLDSIKAESHPEPEATPTPAVPGGNQEMDIGFSSLNSQPATVPEDSVSRVRTLPPILASLLRNGLASGLSIPTPPSSTSTCTSDDSLPQAIETVPSMSTQEEELEDSDGNVFNADREEIGRTRRHTTTDLQVCENPSSPSLPDRKSTLRSRNATEPPLTAAPVQASRASRKLAKEEQMYAARQAASRLKEWCRCRQGSQDSQGDMHRCSDTKCATKWYYRKCLDSNELPEDNQRFWFCGSCRADRAGERDGGEQVEEEREEEEGEGEERLDVVDARFAMATDEEEEDKIQVPEDGVMFQQAEFTFDYADSPGHSRASSPLSDVTMSESEGEDSDVAAETAGTMEMADTSATTIVETSIEEPAADAIASAAEVVKANPRYRKSIRKSATPAKPASTLRSQPPAAASRTKKRKASTLALDRKPNQKTLKQIAGSTAAGPTIRNARNTNLALEVDWPSEDSDDASDSESEYWNFDGAFAVGPVLHRKREATEEILEKATPKSALARSSDSGHAISQNPGPSQSPKRARISDSNGADTPGRVHASRATSSSSAPRATSATHPTATPLSINVPAAGPSTWPGSLPTPASSVGSRTTSVPPTP